MRDVMLNAISTEDLSKFTKSLRCVGWVGRAVGVDVVGVGLIDNKLIVEFCGLNEFNEFHFNFVNNRLFKLG